MPPIQSDVKFRFRLKPTLTELEVHRRKYCW